jgi:glycosyltransferase involved in cell wall biosynthesis
MVNILMPVYNGEKTVAGSINSILNQTDQDFEFIIIDDASTDNTVEIIKSFNDSRITVVSNKENVGCTISLNRGILLCKHAYILRQDSDDISHPKRLEIFKTAAKETKAKLITSDYTRIDTITDKEEVVQLVESSIIKWKHIFFNHFEHNVMLEKETLIKLGCYNEKYRISQDYALWTKYLVKNIPVCVVKKPLYEYYSFMTHEKAALNDTIGGEIGYNYVCDLFKTAIPEETFKRLRNKIRHKVSLDSSEQILLLKLYELYIQIHPAIDTTALTNYINDKINPT